MNKNEVVCPLIMGKVMYLAHSSCVNLSRNTIFKVLERRLSFRKVFRKTCVISFYEMFYFKKDQSKKIVRYF